MSDYFEISEIGLKLIKAYEGYRAEERVLGSGARIVGFGHAVDSDDTLSLNESDAEELLRADLAPIEQLINDNVFAAITQSQFDALCSLAFSIGEEAFLDSEILYKINNGRIIEAANSFDMWQKGRINGEIYIVDALVRRRTAEKALFLRPSQRIAKAPRFEVVPVKGDASGIDSTTPVFTPEMLEAHQAKVTDPLTKDINKTVADNTDHDTSDVLDGVASPDLPESDAGVHNEDIASVHADSVDNHGHDNDRLDNVLPWVQETVTDASVVTSPTTPSESANPVSRQSLLQTAATPVIYADPSINDADPLTVHQDGSQQEGLETDKEANIDVDPAGMADVKAALAVLSEDDGASPVSGDGVIAETTPKFDIPGVMISATALAKELPDEAAEKTALPVTDSWEENAEKDNIDADRISGSDAIGGDTEFAEPAPSNPDIIDVSTPIANVVEGHSEDDGSDEGEADDNVTIAVMDTPDAIEPLTQDSTDLKSVEGVPSVETLDVDVSTTISNESALSLVLANPAAGAPEQAAPTSELDSSGDGEYDVGVMNILGLGQSEDDTDDTEDAVEADDNGDDITEAESESDTASDAPDLVRTEADGSTDPETLLSEGSRIITLGQGDALELVKPDDQDTEAMTDAVNTNDAVLSPDNSDDVVTPSATLANPDTPANPDTLTNTETLTESFGDSPQSPIAEAAAEVSERLDALMETPEPVQTIEEFDTAAPELIMDEVKPSEDVMIDQLREDDALRQQIKRESQYNTDRYVEFINAETVARPKNLMAYVSMILLGIVAALVGFILNVMGSASLFGENGPFVVMAAMLIGGLLFVVGGFYLIKSLFAKTPET